MADRTSASIFGGCFERIAAMLESDPSCSTEIELRDFANWLWDRMRDYDFSYYQLSADDALLKLGLARWHEEKGEKFIIYKDDVGWE